MSDIFECHTFALDARQAAGKGRRNTYLNGGIGLRVISVEEAPNPPRYRFVRGRFVPADGYNYYKVSMSVAEWRIDYDPLALPQSYFEAMPELAVHNGTKVRTRVVGLDYAGGSRHAMPAGSAGIIVGRVAHHVLVEFPDLPRHRFRYIYSDLGLLPKTDSSQ